MMNDKFKESDYSGSPWDNIIMQKSFSFSLRILKLYKYMQEKNEYVLSKQLLRSSTSIGANITEGQYAQSGPDFNTKMSVAKKEAAESLYWIRLLMASGLVPNEKLATLHDDCEELVKMLVSICKTTNKRNFGSF